MSLLVDHLDDDILGHIFHIAADTLDITGSYWLQNDIKAEHLSDAICLSQVCSRWRALILSLPTIWARLFNFGSRFLHSTHWRNEVIRRSANAPLRVIRFWYYVRNKVSSSLLADILEAEWHRVQYIIISLDETEDENAIKRLISLTHRRSPRLVAMKWVSIVPLTSLSRPTNTIRLFGNDAPLLQVFDYHGTKAPMDRNTTCLSAITFLQLTMFEPFPPDEVLRILEHTPLLESIQILVSARPSKSDPGAGLEWHRPPRRIPLPRLRSLYLTFTSWKCCTDVINRIQVHRLSAVTIDIHSYNPDLSDRMDFNSFCKWLTPPIREEVSSRQTADAAVVVKLRKRTLLFLHQMFTLKVHDIAEYAMPLLDGLFHLLSNCGLDLVTNLKFFINLSSNRLSSYQEQSRQMFRSLSHMTTLGTTCSCLHDIQKLVSSDRGVLPSLDTIKILGLYSDQPHNQELEWLKAFLLWRIEQESPIRTLELEDGQDVITFNENGCYPELESLHGLKTLTWKKKGQSRVQQILGKD